MSCLIHWIHLFSRKCTTFLSIDTMIEYYCRYTVTLKLSSCKKSKYNCTYHTLVPDETHPLLSAIDALRNQSEVIFTHGSLGSVEGTVCTSCHLKITTGQKVMKEKENRRDMMLISMHREDNYNTKLHSWHYDCISSLNAWIFILPGEKGVEIVWCGWVRAQGRGGDIGSCLGPVLAPVVWTICSQACSDWLSVDHSAWKSSPIVTRNTTLLVYYMTS